MKRIFLNFVFFMLFFPVINLGLGIVGDIQSTEKANEVTIDEIVKADFDNRFILIESYFEKRFPARNWIIQKYNYFVWFLLDSSPKRRVVRGLEDWLYIFWGQSPNGRDYSFKKKEFEIHKIGVEKLRQFCTHKGIKFYSAVVPEKFNIYPEYLKPDDFSTIKRDKYFKIHEEYRKSKNPTIFFHEELFLTKPLRNVYYKTDTHWNSNGAFIASKKVISIIKQDFPNLSELRESDFDLVQVQSKGKDLGDFLSLGDYLKDDEFLYISKKNEKGKVADLHIVVIHDSYFYPMHTFFNQRFTKVDAFNFVQNENMDPLVNILNSKPDIVLFITLERHIGNFDNRVFSIL
ncbi:Conserved hypothetical protein [Leptospira biflexa serovar Patoc strain 'Patoc 1 (Ames)']|uniref:Putative alginate biosynthesis protein AlgJ n=1 Tax=Leptospira biflexa serovar Patoc (strain Patoc 1 / ATCC 23582 / Paris) TaxID=456481 RepID=B0SSL8_LEPBP|nr:Conserved hypothetical protein [Leptospira biflexa serovar Patoc strain 'Patoc 1 (Ames)']ABZ98108.1 Putative alginate biosynthesis protein AlgJ precursor [Leptospira biflexa serovar Patoc strain 'Patoc 1 (Paris)']